MLCAASSLVVCMDKPELPVQALQKSVYNRLDDLERRQGTLETDVRFSNGYMEGRIDSLAKRNDAEFKRLQALLQKTTKETQDETKAIKARLDAVEGGLAAETVARQAADAAQNTRIDNTQAVLAGTDIVLGVAVVGVVFASIHSAQVSANVEVLYKAFNKDRNRSEWVKPAYQ